MHSLTVLSAEVARYRALADQLKQDYAGIDEETLTDRTQKVTKVMAPKFPIHRALEMVQRSKKASFSWATKNVSATKTICGASRNYRAWYVDGNLRMLITSSSRKRGGCPKR